MSIQPWRTTVACAGLLLASVLASAQAGPLHLHLITAGLDGACRQIPKQVKLIAEEDRLIASNIRLSRVDAEPLADGEQVEQTAEAEAVIVVATNQRLLGYGAVVGWRAIPRETSETLESIVVEDFAGFVVTGQRYLNFNGDTGLWAAEPRQRP